MNLKRIAPLLLAALVPIAVFTANATPIGTVRIGSGTLSQIQTIPGTSGGASVYTNIDIDETTATTSQQLKGSAGTLYSCAISNNTASTIEYVKFYNAVSLTGSAAGTETPVMTVPIAGASTITLSFPMGYSFSTGMTIAATTGIGLADTGAPATNAIVINCTYK